MQATDVSRDTNGSSQSRWKLISRSNCEGPIPVPRTAFENVLRQVPAPILVVRGRQLLVEAANDAAEALVQGDTIVGRPLCEALPAIAESRCLGTLIDAIGGVGGDDGTCIVLEFAQQPGAKSTVGNRWRVSCKRLREADAKDLMVLTFADMTVEAARCAALERLAATACAANDERNQLLAMLAHELRGPLAPMVRSLERIQELGVSMREHAVIERQVRHLQRLIDDLLDVASVARGGVALRKRHVEVREFVTAAIERVAPLIEERNQALIVEVPTGLIVEADPDRMSQVVCNLLGNAAKFSPEHAEIVVNACIVLGRVRLTVADRGIGLAAESIEAIVTGSCGGHGHAARGGHGASLGLGLMIVRDLVCRHGGELLARSSGPRCGSEFVVELPAATP